MTGKIKDSDVIHAVESEKRQPRRLSLAEARLRALETSEKAERERIAYSEQEGQRSYDYKADE
jgi:hypothetical protein